MGRRPDLLSCFFKSRANVPVRERPSGFAAGKAAKRQACCGSNKDIRRRRQKSRAAYFFGRGRRPDAPFVLLFQKQVKCSRKGTPNRRQGFNFVPAIPPPVCTDSRFAKPRKFPKGNGFILFASTKRTKSSPEGCDPLDSEGRFKTLSIIFFRDISGSHP